jgi:DNA (cytosine-5)-methyltransferase 1
MVVNKGVRRTTVIEAARLQGFPDDYLDITYRNKPAADGNKFRALGNSMAVPVIHWLGVRIEREIARRGRRTSGARGTSSPGAT